MKDKNWFYEMQEWIHGHSGGDDEDEGYHILNHIEQPDLDCPICNRLTPTA